jgi:hypothetical protein
MATVTLDFCADWMAWADGELRSQGYKRKSGDFMDTCIQLHNLRRRLLSQRPRAVSVSRELVCPPELQYGYDLVRKKVERGEPLRPHLSRGLTKLEFNDALLNDWGIYHLHLGTTVAPDGFVDRTGPVLFARFEDDRAYFLLIEPHGAWEAQRLPQVLDANWRQVTAQFSLPGVVKAEYEPTDEDVRLLRKQGITPIITVGSAPLASMGGGITCAKTSAQVSFQCIELTKLLRTWEKAVLTQSASQAPYVHLVFRLEIRGTEAFAVEKTTGTTFKLGAGAA